MIYYMYYIVSINYFAHFDSIYLTEPNASFAQA
mgnify:CR=1 FL=1